MLAKNTGAAPPEDESAPQLRRVERNRRGSARTDPLPCNDTSPGEFDHGFAQDLDRRLREAFGQGLLDPLSTVGEIAAELKREGNATEAQQAQRITDAVSRIDSAIHDLLEFTLIAIGGGMYVQRRRVDLQVLCERVLDTIERANPNHPIVFTCDSPVEGEWDPDRIAALLSRLVVIAVEHPERQRTVRVVLRRLQDQAILDVFSPGPPVDRALVPFAVEPFGVGRRPGASSGKGLGLGLYLSREIARAHGGRIDVRWDALGATTFSVTLPRRAP